MKTTTFLSVNNENLALFTKESKLPLNKGFKKCFSYYSLAINPRFVPKDVADKMNLLLYRILNEQIDM